MKPPALHDTDCAQAANIHLAGNFFRQYLAPVARRYHEINYESVLAIGGATGAKPKKGAMEAPIFCDAIAVADSVMQFDWWLEINLAMSVSHGV